jgi:glycosyltransferase involved in cell wall biosynthesis
MTLPSLRIAVVANTAWYLFNFRLNLMQALVSAGHEVVAVSPDDVYAPRVVAAGIAFTSVDISGDGVNPLREIKSVFQLRRLLHQQKIDVVLSYTPKGNIYSAMSCISLGIPFVPNVSGLGRAFIRRSPLTWIARTLYRLTFHRAEKVFFQNPDDMAVFLEGNLVPPARAERLPGSGVDLRRFGSAESAGSSQDAPVFLLVARMLWDKGVGEYVAAARDVRKLFPGATFRLLGFIGSNNPSAISREQIDSWVKEGVVSYSGPTDDVRPHLAAADCVVLPSYREGVPRVLLEAAAMARPVITTDAPGCREAVVDGETGYLCEAANVQDLTAKLLAFIRLPLEDRLLMGERGRAFVERNFDERVVLDRYLAAIASINARCSTAGRAN